MVGVSGAQIQQIANIFHTDTILQKNSQHAVV